MKQYPAKIFLAEKQLVHENATARTASVFGGVNGWFGNLYMVNDETLAPGSSVQLLPEIDTTIIIPIVGDLIVVTQNKESALPCGEAMVINGRQSEAIKLQNGYDKDLINYLQIRIHSIDQPPQVVSKSFQLDCADDELNTILDNKDFKVFIGKMQMRQELSFPCGEEDYGVFCFVIQGSFEVCGRLLHHRDGLAIWDAEEIEIESLGKESILLLIEIRLN